MKNKILCIYTEDLNFFYKLNKELNRFTIKYEILNIGAKIPQGSSVILTTKNDLEKFKIENKSMNFLVYHKEDNFNYYILKVLAAYRIEFKLYYSNLTFVVDPGTKRIGIVIFLDDYYLISYTIYNKSEFLSLIKNIVDCFQKDNPSLIKLNFKFGRGIYQITIDLVKNIYQAFPNRDLMQIYLIDESKSSKTKIQDKYKRIKTKHEASALILSFRKGIEINQTTYFKTLKQIKNHKNFVSKNIKTDNITIPDVKNKLNEIIMNLLNNNISLTEASKMIQENS